MTKEIPGLGGDCAWEFFYGDIASQEKWEESMKGGGEGFRVVVLVSGGGGWGFVNNSNE